MNMNHGESGKKSMISNYVSSEFTTSSQGSLNFITLASIMGVLDRGA